MRRIDHLLTTLPLACLLAATGLSARAADTTPAAELARFNGLAGTPGVAERGRQFFTTRHGKEWSCDTCHGAPPVRPGRHTVTGKTLAPLAPAANAEAFTQRSKVDKWFRRNCQDVLGRTCTPAEQADVLAYLTSLKP